MDTTLGQLAINAALPEDLRDYNRVLDSRGVQGLLREVAGRFPSAVAAGARARPFLSSLHRLSDEEVAGFLAEEEARERAADQAYWAPLRKELERIRRERLS